MLSETSFLLLHILYCEGDAKRFKPTQVPTRAWLGKKQMCRGGAMDGGEAMGSVVRD